MRLVGSRTMSSSSTNRIVFPYEASGLACDSSGSGEAVSSVVGSMTSTLVPRSGCEEMTTYPPAWVTIPYTVASPKPEPSPSPFVVKNGSKARSDTVLDIPQPVSETVSRTYWPRPIPR